MFAAISPKDYDIDGPLIVNSITTGTDVDSMARRLQRTATLDGGTEVIDHGFSHADRTLRIEVAEIDATIRDRLRDFVSLYTRLYVTVNETSWECAPLQLSASTNTMSISFYIIQKASA
jgi:hypothetical protein